MEQHFSGLILALLVTFATAGPINIELFKDSRTCAKRCLSNGKFDYDLDTIYVYKYEAESKTNIVGASEDSASVHIRAMVEIQKTSPCDFEMRLKDASLVDPYQSQDGKFSPAEFGQTLTQWPLRFSYQDGRIEDLCPNAEDPSWSLNIKRGILSAFQNSMTRLDADQTLIETDVTGSCETEYHVVDEPDTILKTKDLVNCKHRQGINSAVQSIGYDANSNIQCLAIMKSFYNCKQKINKDSDILEESLCTERLIFRPFSNGANGAATMNTQTLRFMQSKSGGQPSHDEIKYRTDLLFSHQFGARHSPNAEDKIKMKLKELCQIFKDDVRPEQPQLFTELIREMKMADSGALNAIYKQIKNRKICPDNPEKIKKMFHDAIPMVGTSGSLQVIRDLIWKREVVDLEKDMWLASLPFIQHPEKEMLSAIKPLLEEKNVEGNTILLISSLVSGYCSVNPKCGEVAEVAEIMDVLQRMIGKCSSKGPFEKILYALRAIGNIGHSKSIVPRLTQCFTRRENPVQIRLAAIDAFRRIPCDVMRVDLQDLFNDISEDSELRINAYLALMKCPHKNILMRVKESLRNEKTNQVGSFVWTHLTNLRETSDPHLQEVREILEDEELKKEFNKDKRKFSRNYEGSFFLDELNVGGKVDSNVIFSPKSFVPRSANLNLTIDLFGSAINFFEMGTRMEGVEYFLERYFGNNGYFKNKKDTNTNHKFPMRPFDDQYKVDIDALKGFAYVRMFGNELGFWQFEDPNLSFFKNFDIKKLVKNEKIAFSKNMALMDTQLIVPTLIGLPLNLTVAATASIDVEAMGKMNLASFKNIEIGGSIKPSAAVKVVSEITVDAFATKAGLRMNSMAHSSTEAKMNFQMKNGKVIESKLEFPKKRMEIITFKSDFAIIQGDMVKNQRMIEDNRVSKNKCTGENFNKITGLKLCTDFQFANASKRLDAPYFPFTGPVVMQVELVNQDVPEGYAMKTFVSKNTQSGFVIDTPNSKVNRKISLNIDIEQPEKTFEFDSPWKKLTFNGKLLTKRKTRVVSGELILDHKNSKIDKYTASFQLDYTTVKGEQTWMPKIDIMSPTRKMLIHGTITNDGKRIAADFRAAGFYEEEVTLKMTAVRSKREYSCITTLRFGPKEYYLKTKVGMVPKGKMFIYSPELIFIVEGQERVKFESSFLFNPKAKIIANFKLDKVFSKIVAANMLILLQNTKKKMKHKLNFDLKAPQTNIDVMGLMELKESRFMSRMITTYNIGKYQDKLTISSKLLDKSTKSLSFYDGDLTLDSKRDPKKNFILKGQFGKADHHLETQLALEVGNPKRNPEKLNFASILNYHIRPREKNINYTMSFTRPSKDVDVGFKLSHVNMQMANKIENDVELKYGPEKTVGSKVHFTMKDKNNFEGFVSIRHLEKELFRLEDKMTSPNPRNYNNHMSVTVPGGKTVTLQSAVEKQSDMSFHMSNTLRLPNNREVKINGKLNIERENGSMSVEVDADRGTIKNEPWNPKFAFNYHINMQRQMLSFFRSELGIVLSPKKKINISYFMRVVGDQTTQEIIATTPFRNFNRIECKYTVKQLQNYFKENFLLIIDNYYIYEEELMLQIDKRNFVFDYMLKQNTTENESLDLHIKASSNRQESMAMIKFKDRYDTVNFEMNVDHTPNTVDVKANVDMSLPQNGFTFKMSSVSTVNMDEFSFNSKGEINLHHPRVVMDLTYFARADENRITFDANFVSPTSRHKNGKLAIDIAIDDRRRNLTGKFDVDYNDSRLYSLNAGYKFERDIHNFQLAFLLPNGERITTVFNLGMSPKQTVYAELKLPRAFKLFELELDMNGFAECKTETCNHHLRITTNSPSFPNLYVEMKRTEMGLVNLQAQLNAFKKNMEFMATLEGEDWNKKTIMSHFSLDGQEKLNLEGNYMIHSPRKFEAKFLVTSKIGRHDDKFNFNVRREVMSGEEGVLEITGMFELFNKKYEASLMGKNFNEIKAKLMTPKLNYEATLNLNRLMWNDFDVMLDVQQDSDQYRISAFNRHFQEMKLSAAMPSFSDFEIVYNGGIDDRKLGNFHLKISYGEYFVEGNTTINMSNQLELKSTVAFKLLSWASQNPKTHTGSGEIKLKHNFDSIFQKITGNFVYGKETINFMSQVKNTGKINMNMRLKTSFKFNANVKAQIKPGDMYNTDLSLNFDTKWTGPKKLTYSHSGQMRKNLQIKADLEGKGKETEYTLNVNVMMKNEYGLKIEFTTDNMANKYIFDGELMMNRQMEKGRLRVEAPFAFMDGQPMEISFTREGSKFASRGNFKMMEYNMDVEYGRRSIMAKAYINWNKEDRGSNFNFTMNFDDVSNEAKTDKKFNMNLIHPVRTVAFLMKYVKTSNMLELDTEISANVKKGQKIGFAFGRTQDAGYLKVALPQRTYKFSGRVNNDSGRQLFDGSFFWDFDNDDSKKIDLTATMFYRNKNAIFDVILKFPPQTKGVQLKSEFSWFKGDTLFKSKTEFSFNQDPNNVFTAQTELLKDDNNKYTFTMAMMHPKSNWDMFTTFRMFELNNKLTASMDMKYGGKNANMMAYLDKNNNEISMKLRSKEYNAEFFGHFVMEDDYEISAKIERENRAPLEAYINLSPSRNNLRVKFNYDEFMHTKTYHINGNLLTNQMVAVEAFRRDDDAEHDETDSDVTMKFMLEDSNILHGKITWRPVMSMELMNFLHKKVMDNMGELEYMMNMLYNVMNAERQRLSRSFYREFHEETKEIGDYMSREFHEIYTETSEMFQQVGEMYQRNYLYLNTIIRELSKYFYEFEYHVVTAVRHLEDYFHHGFMQYYPIVRQKLEEAKIQFNQVYQETYRKLSYDIMQARYYIMEKLEMWNRQWEIKRDEYLRKLDELNRRTYQEIFNHKYTKAFLMAINHKWDELIDFMRSNDMKFISDWIHYFQENMDDFNDNLNEFMDDIRHHPATQEIFSVMNEIYQQLVWAYKYWEIEETVRNFDDRVKNYITSTANEVREQIFSMNNMKLIEFNLQSGVIEFEFPLVMPMFFVQNQEKIDRFWQMTKHTMNKLNEWQMEYNFTIQDLYYSMKPSSNPADWLPPFKAQAYIFRDQHITTFDGVHLDFKGNCSYILTRDFVDNNFTVIANFGPVQRDMKILSVIFHVGSEKLELFHDYQIQHNNNRMDLPINLNDLSVNRMGNRMEIRSQRMFTVIFDPTQGTVIVDISGWYFGRVAGLFGTYNYEQFDDMMMPESRWTTNVDEFAFSWAMPSCKSRNNFAQFERKLHRCEYWFLDSYSPFRNCFRQVEPDSFYHACNTIHNPRIDICTVARFYIDRCAEKGVPLDLPEQCMMCKTKHGNMFMSDEEVISNETKIEELERSSDIVFVVEQSKCNQRIAADLNTIIQRLEQTLQGKGMNNNRYGFVGFGGDNIPNEYFITIRSELMASAGLIMNEIRQLEFYDGHSIIDQLKAISLATQYPFRPAVRKTIILVTCNMFCMEKSIPYQRVLQQLRDHDITLHLLKKHDFEMSGNKSPKTTDLYGIDSRQVFTKTEGNTDEKMFETIKLPTDNCAELALASNGSVFDATKMIQGDKSMFSHRFTQRIADSLKLANCYNCRCGQNEMGMTQPICTRCPSIIEQYSYSPSFYSPGKLFQGNFKINENLKEQLNMYWERFKKTPKAGGPPAKKPAAKKGAKKAGKKDSRRRRRR